MNRRRKIVGHETVPGTLFVWTGIDRGGRVARRCAPKSEDAVPPHEDWIIESQVTFPEKDGRSANPGPNEPLRLWAPYVVGDIYGSPNAGEISPVNLRANLTFTMNLNLGYRKLARALVPTQFSQKWMSVEPREARVARVLPYVLPADGIAPVVRPSG